MYDVPRNFIGDTHWSGHSGGKSATVIEEGDELALESGILVEVAEAVGETETDLSELIRKRTVAKETRRGMPTELVKETSWIEKMNGGAAEEYRYRHRHQQQQQHTQHTQRAQERAQVQEQAQAQVQRKHKSLSSLLGTPKGPHGRAVLPSYSPYDVRFDQQEHGDSGRETKRQRVDRQAAKENLYPRRSVQDVLSSPIADRRDGRQQMATRDMGSRGARKESRAAPIDLSSDEAPPSPLRGARGRIPAIQVTTIRSSSALRKSRSPTPTLSKEMLGNVQVRDKGSKQGNAKNENKRVLRPQTLRIGSAKPRRMLLTESMGCETEERPPPVAECTEAARIEEENGRTCAKRQQQGSSRQADESNTSSQGCVSNIAKPYESQLQRLEQIQDSISRTPARLDDSTMLQLNRKKSNNQDHDKVAKPALSPSPPPVLSVLSKSLTEPDIVTANTIKPVNNTSKLNQPQDSILLRSPKSTTTRNSNPISTRAIAHVEGTVNNEPISAESRPPPTPDANKTLPTTNRHASVLQRPFRRVRSVPSNANANADTNADSEERNGTRDVICNAIIDNDDTTTSAVTASKERRTLNQRSDMAKLQRSTSLLPPSRTTTTNSTSDAYSAPTAANARTTMRMNTYNGNNNSIKSSSSIRNPKISTRANNVANDGDNASGMKNEMAKDLPVSSSPISTLHEPLRPLPIAEETGPWSVEALDLIDWRPPDWDERMRRVQQETEMEMETETGIKR